MSALVRNAVALSVAAAAFTLAVLRPSGDPDMWWHLASGRWMVEHRDILRVDVFSSTATGDPYAVGGWLGEIVMYAAFAVASWPGLAVLRAVLLALAALSLTRVALRSAPPTLAVPLVALAVVLSWPTWTDGPELFTLALFAGSLDLLFAARAGARAALAALVALLLVWSDLDVGYALGLALLWLFAIAALLERRNPAAFAIAAVVAAALLGANPGALPLLRAIPRVVEGSPSDALTSFGALFAIFVGAALLLFLRRGGSLLAALVLVPLLWLALLSQRQIHLFGFAAVAFISEPLAAQVTTWKAPWTAWRRAATGDRASPAVADASSKGGLTLALRGTARSDAGPPASSERARPPTPGRTRRRSLPGVALAIALWLGALASVITAPAAPDQSAYPVGATDALRSSSGVLLNELDWGGWLIWNVPQRYVFVDGRLYPFVANDALGSYRDAIHLLPRWRSVITRWNVSQALLRPERPLVEALREEGWTVRSAGEGYVLLERPR